LPTVTIFCKNCRIGRAHGGRGHSIRRLCRRTRQELSGKLRVTSSTICIQRLAAAATACLRAPVSDIDIELIASHRGGGDLSGTTPTLPSAPPTSRPPTSSASASADFAYAVYATPELYGQYLEDRRKVSAITWNWMASRAPRRRGSPDAFPGYADALPREFADHRVRPRAAGHGFTLLPCAIGDIAPELAPRPRRLPRAPVGFWCCRTSTCAPRARIRIFRDFMLEAIEPYVPLIRGERETPGRLAR